MATLGQMLTKREAQELKVKELADQLKEEKHRLKVMDTNIMNRMQDDGIEKTASKTKVYGFMDRAEYRVDPEEWETLYKHIRRHNRFELLHKRLSSTVAKMYMEEGKRIPGLKLAEWQELSVRAR